MNLQLGWVYKFVFVDGFSTLDDTYVLVKDCTYEEMLKDGKNLYTNLYSHVGLEQKDLEVSLPIYKTDKILKLVSTSEVSTDVTQEDGTTVSISTNRQIYVPVSVIKNVPIHNVNKYSKLVLAFNVGVYPGEEDLTYIKESIYERLHAELGFVQSPDVFTIDKVWLTDDEYNTLKTDRENNITKITNYFSENQRLQAHIADCTATIDAYERIVKSWEGV